MRTEGALEFLGARCPAFADFVCETGTRGDAAFLRATQPGVQARWAMLSTPGDRWFSLDVDGGFSVDHFEEDASDSDVCRLLDLYVEAALAYLRGDAEVLRKHVLAPRAVAVRTSAGRVVLRRSLTGFLKSLVPRAGGEPSA